MPKRIALRPVTPEEEKKVRQLARSYSQPLRLVQRAQIIVALLDEPNLTSTEAGIRAGVSKATGPKWVARFNKLGLAGLEDEARAGRPRTHTEQVRSRLIDLALQKPQDGGEPFPLWTLERLQRSYKARYGLHLSVSTIWSWLAEEGLTWKRQQS